MRRLKFSREWDKLKSERFKKGNTFTTFRAYAPYIHNQYMNYDGVFEVQLNNKPLGTAMLMDYELCWSNELTNKQVSDDTYDNWKRGEWNALIKSFYKTQPVYGIYMNFKIMEVYE